MRMIGLSFLTAAFLAGALSAPTMAASKKKVSAKKSCGEYMYVDKKSGKCADARNKKSAGA